jgi:alkyl-hydroperoxide reductase/thiol specific antioxidant family protein
LCREQVAELRPRADEFAKAGGRVAVIGNGWPAMAKSWAEHVGFPPSVAILTDPSRKAYDLAGMKRSVALTLFNPFALVRWGLAHLHGFRQGKTAGDAWQQGGALVVQPGGKVTFRYVSLGPGDHPRPAALLAALKRAA